MKLVLGNNRARPGVLHLYTVGTWGWIILCRGDCLVHCRMFIPGLYLLDASSSPSCTPPSAQCDNQKYLPLWPHVPRGTNPLSYGSILFMTMTMTMQTKMIRNQARCQVPQVILFNLHGDTVRHHFHHHFIRFGEDLENLSLTFCKVMGNQWSQF